MKKTDFSIIGTRRQWLTGTLALVGDALFAQKKYGPRIAHFLQKV
jgi:hypothetical protein